MAFSRPLSPGSPQHPLAAQKNSKMCYPPLTSIKVIFPTEQTVLRNLLFSGLFPFGSKYQVNPRQTPGVCLGFSWYLVHSDSFPLRILPGKPRHLPGFFLSNGQRNAARINQKPMETPGISQAFTWVLPGMSTKPHANAGHLPGFFLVRT